MTLSMLGIGLFKTQGLDEYGTAAVGWLRGAGLKATEGPAEQQREVGSKHTAWLCKGEKKKTQTRCTHDSLSPSYTHTQKDKTKHRYNTGATRRQVDGQSFPSQL